jgi:phosphoserine phosphatase
MADDGIQCVFQLEDVFNKRKRVILFDLRQSLLRSDQLGEILEHTALTAQRLERAYGHKEPLAALRAASELLEGVPADVMATVVDGVTATSDTVELLQTLKVMGYKIVVVSTAFSPITESISARLGLDDCHGVRLALDDDSRTYVGEIRDDDYLQTRAATVAPRVALREGLGEGDVTVISDHGLDCTPGVHLRVDLGRILELYNTHALSQDWLLGLLGSFGVPRSFH